MGARLEYMVLGSVMTNCYFLMNEASKEMILFDPADRADQLITQVERMGGAPVAILLTHGHFDHILAAEEVAKHFGCPIYAEAEEAELLADPMLNHSGLYGNGVTLKADKQVREGDVLAIAGFEIHVMHTPGHTAGSCCYYFPNEKILFSGDTLFCRSCGRTDFETSDPQAMTESLRRLLNELPEEIAVYPGHDRPTSIGEERQYNPFAPR